ncbi:unnamed protein product [Acanthoscelides obtectus]|uniref:rRNA-processing protein UTP23 homolog n=1 Tax=Acanthoscelides obtectus TaxID=200917 RepID=A0A9P0NWQ1_ACAOB|nr:unnamed protein product [Acanthoscelides obtectus]CAK1634618.1 rRNA-processing protein UTP23 homolog [Acanthoscelides obtectus]
MKIKRYKKVNKHLGFYINNFGLRQPYQLLVDGTFCYAALNNKINIANDIPRYLQGDIKLLTTQCAVIEMENLGPKLNGALLILKKYVVHKCGHERKPITGAECLLSMLGKTNTKHYIIATQDRDLQDKVRNIPGAPILYLHIKTPVFEQPSKVSMDTVKDKLCLLSHNEKQALENLKVQSGIECVEEDTPKKKKKKNGPNPLSCKKKMKKGVLDNPIKKKGEPEKEKKKRKKVRIPKHVKEELLKKKD